MPSLLCNQGYQEESASRLLQILVMQQISIGVKKRDCAKTKGTSLGCECSTELVFRMIVFNVK